MKDIGINAFMGCSSVKSVTIAESVTEIGRNAFSECDILADITFKGSVPEDGCAKGFAAGDFNIHIPCDATGDTRRGYEAEFNGKVDSTRIIDMHDCTYTASGAVITEKCENCGHSATATLSVQDGADLTYTGEALTPVQVVYKDWIEEDNNKPDASEISYSNNTDAGTATAKLTISGAEASLNFTISSANISSAVVTLDSTTLTYNNAGQTKNVSSVKVGSRTLIAGTDYKVSGNTGTNAGTYTLTITGTGNYTGTKTVDFTIAAKSLTDDMVTVAIGPHYYTGNTITPAVTVKDGSTALTAGTDYSVSYKDNVNPGTATVTIAGKGNYTGSINKTFTIEYSRIPDGKSLTDYVTIMPEPTDGWYNADIILTIKEGCSGVGTTPAGIGENATVTKETGKDGDTQTVYIKDSAGNIYQTEFTYKLEKTPPVIDLTNMSVVDGTKTLWSWIVGKKSMVIKIPASDITDALSGIAEVTYTATPDSGTEQTGTIRAKGGYYEIALNAEFTGTIRLTAKDNAGNTTQVSLTADGGKVIAEDYAPVVTITLPDTPTPNVNGWYTTAFAIAVTVTDDKDSDSTVITSGGIAEIKWKDGGDGTEQTVSGLPGAAPVYEKEFTITVNTDGTHTYYVQAVDNAGNESGWQTVTVGLDTTAPAFSGNPVVTDRTQESADIALTPSEGGKVYWIVSDIETAPSAQEVKNQSGQNGNEKDITGGTQETFTVGGLQPGTTHKVYVVLEDVAGNLSEVKEVSFTTLQAAPEITLEDIDIDHEKETIKIPDSIGKVEVYTDPSDPSGSKIQPEADGSLPVEPGTSIYIRYPAKTEDGETTPPSGSVKIDIPDRPTLSAKKVTVTDTTAKVTDPAAGEEYVLVKKGQTPDWSEADTTGAFTGLEPNTEYDLYARKKATDTSFVSDPVKTEVRTLVTIKEPVITGDGAGEDGNTAFKPEAPGAGGTVTFTGTYGEEYVPVIIVGGQEMNPGAEMTWDEGSGKGGWEYTLDIPEDAKEAGITVEFRKRTITGIAVTPGTLTIYADHAANESIDALTSYLKENSSVQAAYDNQTKGAAQAEYTTADSFTVKGGTYSYTVSAEGKTGGITLKVLSVNAALTAPAELMQTQKADGYTAEEVAAWLPAQVAVTYTGDGYKARTENRTVTWRTDAIGADFGKTLGRKTISGTVALPAWATGQDSVSIGIEFVDRLILTDSQMKLSVSGWVYGAQTAPAPQGSITVTDTNPAYTYLYSADNGGTWVTAPNLPKSESGNIVPGGYQVKMTYRGDNYTGEKTASFTVTRKALDVLPGTLAVNDKNYDGTTEATLKEGSEPALSGVITGDTVTLGGTLSAVFTNKGPKKNIPVTVTGFELTGRDAGYYELGNTTLTLNATINNADGTPPSSSGGGGNSGGNGDDGNGGGGNDDDGNGGGGDGGDNGGSTPGDDRDPGTPPADKTQPAPGTEGTPDKETETQPESQPEGTPKQDEEPENKDNRPKPESEQQPENVTEQTVPASIVDGRIVAGDGGSGNSADGGRIATGNVPGMADAGTTPKTSTLLALGDGAVIVTVVCEEQKCTAGVADTVAVANAVLTPEQIQLVNDGETIEVRIDVKDISETVSGQDKEVIERGLAAYQNEMPELTLGMYVDISMFIRLGESEWDAVTSTEEPIEVIIGIPTELLEEGREFYIIRSHEGEYTLLNDMDSAPDTITISTNLFSAYAIAFRQVDADDAQEGNTKCGLCHICPTFLGICCFIWLAIIAGVIIVVVIVILKRKKETENA